MTDDPPSSPDNPPLLVDLDADLLGGNLAAEQFWASVGADWRALLPGPDNWRYAPGRLDIARLPYDPRVLDEIAAARRKGHRVVLVASAAAQRSGLADAVAGHLGLFDAVEPREAAPPAGQRPTRPNLPIFAEALRAMRPHQWVKNLLVFLPMIVAQQLDAGTFGRSLLAFLSFSLIASAVYLLNDLVDLDADRRHKTKRNRPFASGRLPLASATRLVPGLAIGGFAFALPGGPGLVLAMLAYAVTTTAYSFQLKGTLAADIIVLAVLYTLRIIAGAAATSIVPSMWLLSFSIFLFLSLGAVKRLSELVDLETQHKRKRAEGRAYKTEDRPVIAMIATSAGFLAVLVLALYIDGAAQAGLYAAPVFLWGISLVLLYWISRIVLLAHRGQVDQDPVLFALRDRTSRWVGLAIAVLFVAAVVG